MGSTRYTPVIVVVPESVAKTLDEVADAMGEQPPELVTLMQRNGWTLSAVAGGAMLCDGLRSNGVPA